MKRFLLIVGLAVLMAGCATKAQQVSKVAPATVAVCTTDADCERKAEAQATPREIHYCKGITLKGARCTRKVKADGDYCWQHEIQKNPCWRPKGSQPKEDCYYQDGDVTRPIPGKP